MSHPRDPSLATARALTVLRTVGGVVLFALLVIVGMAVVVLPFVLAW